MHVYLFSRVGVCSFVVSFVWLYFCLFVSLLVFVPSSSVCSFFFSTLPNRGGPKWSPEQTLHHVLWLFLIAVCGFCRTGETPNGRWSKPSITFCILFFYFVNLLSPLPSLSSPFPCLPLPSPPSLLLLIRNPRGEFLSALWGVSRGISSPLSTYLAHVMFCQVILPPPAVFFRRCCPL